MIGCLGVWPVVLVPQPQIERQIRTEPPIVLHEEIKRIGAEVVGSCPGLQRSLLREAQQEVRKIVARVGYRLRASGFVLRRGEPGKHKTALRIPCRVETLQNAAVVSAETPVMFSPIPGNCLRNRVSLVQLTAWRRVVQSAKRRETDSRQPPVERIVRNPANPRAALPGNVRDVRIEIRRGNMVVVIVHPENVCNPALPIGPSPAGVQPLCSRFSRKRRNRIHDVARAARPVHSEIDVVL